jgi:hypothetical protein
MAETTVIIDDKIDVAHYDAPTVLQNILARAVSQLQLTPGHNAKLRVRGSLRLWIELTEDGGGNGSR